MPCCKQQIDFQLYYRGRVKKTRLTLLEKMTYRSTKILVYMMHFTSVTNLYFMGREAIVDKLKFKYIIKIVIFSNRIFIDLTLNGVFMKKTIFFAGLLLCAQPAYPVQFSARDLVGQALLSGIFFASGMIFSIIGSRPTERCVLYNGNYLGIAEDPYALIDRSNIVFGYSLMLMGAIMAALTIKDSERVDEKIDQLELDQLRLELDQLLSEAQSEEELQNNLA